MKIRVERYGTSWKVVCTTKIPADEYRQMCEDRAFLSGLQHKSFAQCKRLLQERGLLPDPRESFLFQTDIEIPLLASHFGWARGFCDDTYDCYHEDTDGTIDCRHCGKTVSEFSTEADAFLTECERKRKFVEDPGYL